ncbi:sulfatase-like hydrolase/transferase [Flagellimonas sp. S3867]|uniref:sulfatase-like hydrolase/transferase n=1 Tax=Flagellimonas sp. S3867 TaxID=2768063 RepID=UPI0016840424|nr:sulfatase-like hydrolase/transferase [Flagellimonas sp. S3867]
MKRWLPILFIIFIWGCKHHKTSENIKQRPNIILIMADDLGYETLGVYGSDSYKTPHLDRLANEGMRFEHCYSTPLCTPSRVQLMTGKYSFRNYIGFGLLDPNEKTFGHYMQKAGYETCIAGKWQLLGNPHQQKLAGGKIGTLPGEAGFDDYCLWQIDQFGSRYKDPLLSVKGKGTKKFESQFGPDVFVEHIKTFMRANKENPFFVYYPMVLTHDPFVPTPDNAGFVDFDTTTKVNDTTYFGEMVTYMDKLVGRIVDETEKLGIREHTLILFIGDNGTDRDVISLINGKPLKGDKGYTTDAGTHVPFIANWKGTINPGSVNNNLIDFTDFTPTLLEVATQEKWDEKVLDGHSFYPQLVNQKYAPRDWVFCHYEPNWGKFEPRRYVHDKTWKLYENGNLFNIEEDPLEENPLQIENQPEAVKSKIKNFRNVLKEYQ